MSPSSCLLPTLVNFSSWPPVRILHARWQFHNADSTRLQKKEKKDHLRNSWHPVVCYRISSPKSSCCCYTAVSADASYVLELTAVHPRYPKPAWIRVPAFPT